jgi:CNT family concentrative nucleoside transporter
MNSFLSRFFTVLTLIGFSFLANAQDNTPIEGTWVLQSTKADDLSQATVHQLDSISFNKQNYKYYTGVDSLNSNGRFILQGDFIALYPSEPQIDLKQFDLEKVNGDSLLIKNKSVTYTFLIKKRIVSSNVQISNELGFSFQSFYRGILGILFILGLCFILSKNKRKIDWRLVIVGITLQVVFAISVLKFESVAYIFFCI